MNSPTPQNVIDDLWSDMRKIDSGSADLDNMREKSTKQRALLRGFDLQLQAARVLPKVPDGWAPGGKS